MLPKDFATWTAFLERRIIDIDEVWYDVHVGRPMMVPEGSADWMLKVIAGVSRKRIDVVTRKHVTYSVIEVKPHANMEAIGQVITYKQLFIEEFEIAGKVESVIVAMTADADILESARQQGVMLYPMMGVML